MRSFILAAALAATLVPAVPALADKPGWAQDERRDDKREERHDRRDDKREAREDRRDDRHDRRDFGHAQRQLHHDRRDARHDARQYHKGDWRTYNRYDYNRPDPRYGARYDAARYYRDDRSYGERRLTRNDRIYRGNDGRYYCRRQDGTTGLIIGALAGGLLGNTLANGRSTTLITLLGVGSGALIGRSIDRGDARCR